jgi:hypothetical protein
MVVLFVVQFIVQFPDGKIYAKDNSIAITLATKIGLGVIVVNAGAAAYVFCLKSGVPVQFGYYHVAFILILLYVIIRGRTSNTTWAK